MFLNRLYLTVISHFRLDLKFIMPPEVRKRALRQQVFSAVPHLWFLTIFVVCFVFLFSICSASVNFEMTLLKSVGHEVGHESAEAGLTRALNNIFEEELATNHEIVNPVEIVKMKMRRELEIFREHIEGAHRLDGNDNNPTITFSSDNSEDISVGSYSSRSKRHKRDTITADILSPQFSVRQKRNISHLLTDDPHVISKVIRMDRDIFNTRPVIDINIVDMGKHKFMFTVEETQQDGISTFIYSMDNDLKVKQIKQIQTPSATSVEVIKINDQWYFLPVEGNYSLSSGQDPLDVGSHVYKFDLATYNVHKEQTIGTAYAKTAVFWKGSGDDANTIYMAVVPQYRETSKGLIRNNVNISCYHWQGGYLDYSFSIPAYSPQSITHFNIFDNDYLAVANYQDDTNSTTIYSEIFKYHHKDSKYMQFQKILTYGAKDIKYFSFRSGPATDHFLAVANFCRKDLNGKCEFRLRSVIYKFSGDRFVPFQTIKTNGALQFLPLKSYGKFLLCLVELHGIKFLQYNGWNFVETFQSNFEGPLNPYNQINLRSFVHNKQPYFSMASTQSRVGSGLYSFEFFQRNNYAEKVDDLLGWCNKAAKVLSSVNTTEMYHNLLKAPKINDNEIHLNGPLVFEKLRANVLHSKSLEYNGNLYDELFYNGMMKKFHTLNNLKKEMRDIESDLSGVVYVDRNQIVGSKVNFYDVEYLSPEISAVRAVIDSLNNFKLHEIFPKLVFMDNNYSLDQLIVEHVIAKDVVVIPNLNGHPISEYALKSPGFIQEFTGKNTFVGSVIAESGFNVFGTLNGIHFTEVGFMLKEGNQTFKGPMVIHNSTAVNLYTQYLNGEDIDYFFKEAVLKSENAVITGNKNFTNIIIKHLFTESTLSGVDINDLANRAIYLRGKPHQKFTGKRTQFQRLFVNELIVEDHVIDGHDIRDLIQNNVGDYKIEQLTLLSDGVIQNLQVNQNLNNFHVNKGRLDVLVNDDSEVQHIRDKELNEMYFEKDVVTQGTVNGVHLPSWSHIYKVFLEENYIDGWIEIKGNLEVPEIFVKGNLSHGKSDVLHALAHSARLDSSTVPGKCHLIFEALRVKGDTFIETVVNGFNPRQWLHRNSTEGQIISAPKTFLRDVHLLRDCHVDGLYDLAQTNSQPENILTVIPDLMTYSGNQTISGDIRFDGSLTVDNLFGKYIFLDGIPLKNILLTSENQNITVKTIFLESLEVRNFFSVNNIMAGLFNGFNLENAIDKTLMKHSDKPQFIGGTFTFEKGFSVQTMKNEGGLVKNYNLDELVKGLIKPQDGTLSIMGTVVLKHNAFVHNLVYDGEMHGISSKDWGNNWLLNDRNQVVHTPVKFKNLKVENINVQDNKVSGIDILHLNESIIWTNEPNVLHKVIFANDVQFLNGVEIADDGLVNGYNLVNNVLLTESNKPQIIGGETVFKNGFTVDGDITAGSLGCLRLDAIANFVYGIDKDNYKSQKLVVFGNLTLSHEPEIMNSINHINWREFLSDVWWIDRDMEINREVEFQDATFRKGIVLHRGPIVSGINLKELNHNYAGKNKENNWTEDVFFINGVLVDGVLFAKDIKFIYGALFNGVDMNEFMDPNNVLMNGIDQNIARPMLFSNLYADEIQFNDGIKINNYNLKHDFMTMGGENVFKGPKRIGDLVILNNSEFDNGTKLNGVDMDRWKQNAVYKNRDYNFNHPMYFENLQANDIRVHGNVNDLQYNKENLFLTTRPNQNVTGRMTIEGQGHPHEYMMNATEIVIVNTINEYDFDKSVDNLVMRGNESDKSPIIIDGYKTFSRPIYIDQLEMGKDKLIYGENLTQIFHELSTFAHMPAHLKVSLKDKYSQMQHRIFELQKYAPEQPFFMAFYELVASIKISSVYTKVVHIGGYPLLSLGIQRAKSIIETSHWNFNLQKNSYIPVVRKAYQSHMQGSIIDFAELRKDAIVITTRRLKEDKPVLIDLPLQSSNNNSELYKEPGKLNQAFVLFLGKPNLVVSQIIYGQEFGKARGFFLYEDNNTNKRYCMMIQIFDIGNRRAEALCFGGDNTLYPLQSIVMKNPTMMTSMTVFHKTIVAIADKDDPLKPEGVIDIWTSQDGALLKKESCIPIINLVGMDSIWTVNYHPFIAIAAGYVKGTRNLGAVYIYRYSTHHIFEKVQTLEIENPIFVRFQHLLISNEILLYVLKACAVDNVLVYKYKGVAGWVKVHQFTAENGMKMEVLDFHVRNKYYGHLAVSSTKETNIFAVRFKGKNYYDEHKFLKGVQNVDRY